MTSLAISPTGGGSGPILFAGTYDGVYRSTDDGTSWSEASSGISNPFITSLAISQGSSETLLAGTSGGGIFRSTNYGASWMPANGGLSNTTVMTLAFVGTDAFAGTYGAGVARSTNDGASWGSAAGGMIYAQVWAICAASNGAGGTNLFAGTSGSGVYMSTNNGTAWTPVRNGMTNLNVWSLAVIDTFLFAGTFWRRRLSHDEQWHGLDSGEFGSDKWRRPVHGRERQKSLRRDHRRHIPFDQLRRTLDLREDRHDHRRREGFCHE